LDCLPPKGFPEPVVSWRKDERELNTQNNEKYQLLDSGNLIVENVCFFIVLYLRVDNLQTNLDLIRI